MLLELCYMTIFAKINTVFVLWRTNRWDKINVNQNRDRARAWLLSFTGSHAMPLILVIKVKERERESNQPIYMRNNKNSERDKGTE